MAVANYNKVLGGVDCLERLHSTFSLRKRHKFKKYYVKLLLFLVEHKLCNKDTCDKEGAHTDFFQAIAESMVNSQTNWNEYKEGIPPLSNNAVESEVIPNAESPCNGCQLPHLNDLAAKLSLKIKISSV
jgi:hypothetical protein